MAVLDVATGLLDSAPWTGRIFVDGWERGAAAIGRSWSRRPATSSGAWAWPRPADVAARRRAPPRPSAPGPHGVPGARRHPAQGGRPVEPARGGGRSAGSSARPAPSRPRRSSRRGSPPARATRRPACARCPTGSCSGRATRPQHVAARARRRGRRHLAVQLPADPVDPRGRAGARAGQRGDPEAGPRTSVSGGVTLARIFEEAGLPDGLFTCCRAAPTSARRWCASRTCDMVSFTGSTAPAAGRRRARPREHLKRVHLELGGNNALIVLDDVDLEKAASVAAWGSFMHQGQICMTTGRHLVQRSIADEYVGEARRARRPPAGRRPDARTGRARPDHRREAARPCARRGDGSRSTAGARLAAGRDVRGALLPADRAGRRADATPRRAWRRSSARSRRWCAFDSIDDAVKIAARHASTGCRSASSRTT